MEKGIPRIAIGGSKGHRSGLRAGNPAHGAQLPQRAPYAGDHRCRGKLSAASRVWSSIQAYLWPASPVSGSPSFKGEHRVLISSNDGQRKTISCGSLPKTFWTSTRKF